MSLPTPSVSHDPGVHWDTPFTVNYGQMRVKTHRFFAWRKLHVLLDSFGKVYLGQAVDIQQISHQISMSRRLGMSYYPSVSSVSAYDIAHVELQKHPKYNYILKVIIQIPSSSKEEQLASLSQIIMSELPDAKFGELIYPSDFIPFPDTPFTKQDHFGHLCFRHPNIDKLVKWKDIMELCIWITHLKCLLQKYEQYPKMKEKNEELEKIIQEVNQEYQQEAKRFKMKIRDLEKRIRNMFTAEEVHETYQEQQVKLDQQEEKYKELERQYKEQKQMNAELSELLQNFKKEMEPAVGEYQTLLLRYDELIKKHKEQQSNMFMLRALYEKEAKAHKRLSTILRKTHEMELHELNSEISLLNANELANQYRESFESQRVQLQTNGPHDELLQY